ncbi:very short patch repair endonuclease [Nocardia sp. NPDC019219]|uniref:very short patch repair endonuclease n=1 Tax=Nocardia sp. NPDC019219 TaxID=3154590 RepID=UPI0033DBDFCE
MRAVRNRDTRPEMQIRSELHRIGLRYRVNRQPVPGVRRSADIVFGPAHVAVMVDGCFWHGCPRHMRPARRNHDFWADKIVANQVRDRETDQMLTKAGWLVLRIWEHEDPAEAAARIASVVSARRAPPHAT